MGNKKKSFHNHNLHKNNHINKKKSSNFSINKNDNSSKNNNNKNNKKELKFVSTNVERKQKNNNTNQKTFNQKLKQQKKKHIQKNINIFNKLEIKENNKFTKFKNKYKKFNAKPRRPIIPYKIKTFNKTTCNICHNQIKDMATSIIDKNSSKSVHFDCLVSKIKKIKNISPREKVVYLGSGTFAIIETTNSAKKTFKIKETIY